MLTVLSVHGLSSSDRGAPTLTAAPFPSLLVTMIASSHPWLKCCAAWGAAASRARSSPHLLAMRAHPECGPLRYTEQRAAEPPAIAV